MHNFFLITGSSRKPPSQQWCWCHEHIRVAILPMQVAHTMMPIWKKTCQR